MKILAIDIGAGTQDILLFDSAKRIENCISLILPTPSKFLARRLRAIEGDVYIYGDTIGGGSLSRAALDHLKKGYRVVMEEGAAYSIRNHLDEVRSMGIEIAKDEVADHFQRLEIREIDLLVLENFLSHFGEELQLDAIATAVQDHGVAPKGIADRAFRFETMEAMLRRDKRPETFCFGEDEIPPYYLRMRSAVRAVRRASSAPVLVMDTSFSAILGCMEEVTSSALGVNVGNGHTIAALVVEGKIEGLYEHHTHELTPEKLGRDMTLFVKGELEGKRVFEDNGHGAVTLTPCCGEIPAFVTSPNRELFKGTGMKFTYAAPGGNTMMTGPIGLIRAALFHAGARR